MPGTQRNSLSDALKGKQAEEKKVEEAKKEDEVNKTEDKRNEDNDKTDGDLIKPASVVEEERKPVDKQADKDGNNDPFGNNDGVTNSGGQNVINKTPADISAESAEETMRRYGYSDEVPQELIDNPNVETDRLMKNYQIPGGTHLHPDVARDNYNRIVGGRVEHGNVQRTVNEQVYATEAPVDDKGIGNKPAEGLA